MKGGQKVTYLTPTGVKIVIRAQIINYMRQNGDYKIVAQPTSTLLNLNFWFIRDGSFNGWGRFCLVFFF